MEEEDVQITRRSALILKHYSYLQIACFQSQQDESYLNNPCYSITINTK